MLIRTKKDGFMFRFDSQKELNSYVDSDKFQARGKKFVGRSFSSWDKFIEICNEAWEEGIQVMEKYVEELKKIKLPEIKDIKRKRSFNDFEGDDIDLQKLLSGEPFWVKTQREQTEGEPTVTIFIDTTTSWEKQSKDILWRGAVAIALAVVLEERGYQCEIWVVNGSKLFQENRNSGVMTSCRLKGCGDTLDTSTLINVVSGWFYRTSTFALLDTICAKNDKTAEFGYGSCYTPLPEDLDLLSRDQNRIYSSGIFSKGGAIEMMEHRLTQLAERFAGKS